MGGKVSNSLEDIWVSWLNSDRWRQFAKWSVGAKFFDSQAYRKLDVARRFATTYYKNLRHPDLFRDVRTFCMFIGHTKSGSSLLGALLDAHPDIILADEADALRYVADDFGKEQIFHILLKGSRREAMKGRVTARRLGQYSLAVPDQWQGRYRKLKVIGDSKAGPSVRRLSKEPELLHRVQDVMNGIDARFIHVIRNPYDPISVMMVRGKRTFENAVEHYFNYCETLLALRKELDGSNLIAVKYEEFVQRPKIHLAEICRFLGVEGDDDYLRACASILHESPERSRDMITWQSDWIEIVRKRIEQVDFLVGYSYEN
jgi:hypothetical protein